MSGLFLGSLFCSIGLSVLVPVPHCFDGCSLQYYFEVWGHYASRLVSISQDCLRSLGLLWFHINVSIVLFLENVMVIALNLEIALGSMAIFTHDSSIQEHGRSFHFFTSL